MDFSTLGKPVLPWTAVSILTISTDQAKFCTFCYYWCILRFDIGLDGFSVTGFSMPGYYNLEAEKDNKLCRENASNLDQQLIIIVITYLI